jgi:hypothetical protein
VGPVSATSAPFDAARRPMPGRGPLRRPHKKPEAEKRSDFKLLIDLKILKILLNRL